jgi:hypothetical protein
MTQSLNLTNCWKCHFRESKFHNIHGKCLQTTSAAPQRRGISSTTFKPGNKRPVTVIDRHKYTICSVLTGTNLIVSVTLSGAHFSGL